MHTDVDADVRIYVCSACMFKLPRRAAALRDALERCIEWADDCMGYALQGWDWKYGDFWRKEKKAAEEALEEDL